MPFVPVTFQAVSDVLRHVSRASGGNIVCECPLCGKHKLYLKEGDGGKALIDCKVCSSEDNRIPLFDTICELIADGVRVEQKPIKAEKPKGDWSIEPFIPDNVRSRFDKHAYFSKCESIAYQVPYCDEDGRRLFVAVRGERKNDNGEMVPVRAFMKRGHYSLWSDASRREWTPCGSVPRRVLLGLNTLTKLKPVSAAYRVIVVEGEKAAIAAKRLVDSEGLIGVLVTTWPCGAGAVGGVELAVLRGWRGPIQLLPDNDKSSRTAFTTLQNRLKTECQVDAVIVEPPAGVPEKWDIADGLPSGVPSLRKFLGLPRWTPDSGIGPWDMPFPGYNEPLREAEIRPIAEQARREGRSLKMADYATARLNRMFGIYYGGQTPAILSLDAKDKIETMALASARHLLKTRQLVVGYNEKNEPIFASAFSLFESHQMRNEITQLIFDPRKPPGFDPGTRQFNMWLGRRHEPKRGDWSPIRDHIRDVICSGDEGIFSKVMDWHADVIQARNELPGVLLALRSEAEGAGKGTTGKVLENVFYPMNIGKVDNPEHFLGRFNDILAGKIVMQLDEAYWPGDKAKEGALRSRITEPTITIEPKYMPKIQIENRTHYIQYSNKGWQAPASNTDRRYMVLDVSQHRVGDREYFHKLNEAICNPDIMAAMIHDMLEHKVDINNIRDLPRTAAHARQIAQTLDRSEDQFSAWVQHSLEIGTFLSHVPGMPPLMLGIDEPYGLLSTQAMHADYCAFVEKKRMSHRRILTENEFRKEMQAIFPSLILSVREKDITRPYRQRDTIQSFGSNSNGSRVIHTKNTRGAIIQTDSVDSHSIARLFQLRSELEAHYRKRYWHPPLWPALDDMTADPEIRDAMTCDAKLLELVKQAIENSQPQQSGGYGASIVGDPAVNVDTDENAPPDEVFNRGRRSAH